MKEQSSKRGSALIYVVLLSVLIIILGSGLLNITKNSFDVSVVETNQEQAYLSAKSGLNFFLSALNDMTSEELEDLYQNVVGRDPSPYEASITLSGSNYEVGDLRILLSYDSINDRIEITARSDVRNTSASTYAYLERSEIIGGFDFDLDKPFYVYDTYTASNNNVEFGSYKGTIQSHEDGFYTAFTSGDLTGSENQYATVLSDKNNLTEKIADAFAVIEGEPEGEFYYNNMSGCSYRSTYYIRGLNCIIRESSIPSYGSNYRFIFDFDHTTSVVAEYIGQDMIYIDPLNNINRTVYVEGEKFYADDVVYLSLRNPADLSKFSVDESDSTGGYYYEDGVRYRNSGSLPYNKRYNTVYGDSSSSSLDGYFYWDYSSATNYNEVESGTLASHPIGSNTIEPRDQDENFNYVYHYDGLKSNNIIFLLDNADPSYATTDPIHISHDLDAWVYAPNNQIIIDAGVTLNGGVIADSVIVDSTAEINGVTPNEGFVNMLKSRYVNIAWEVAYE